MIARGATRFTALLPDININVRCYTLRANCKHLMISGQIMTRSRIRLARVVDYRKAYA